MSRTLVIIAGALAFALSGSAEAQKKPAAAKTAGKKLYRWVDKQGAVHYDDALPAEAVDQAREEFNAKTGNATASVARALTPEERQQQADAAKAAEVAKASADQVTLNEHAMLASYETEADLRRAYEARINLLKQTLESTDVGLQNLHASLTTMLADASEFELMHKPVNAKRAASIRELHAEVLRQQTFQANRKAELFALDGEYQRMLTRYRELKLPAATASNPPVAPQPSQP